MAFDEKLAARIRGVVGKRDGISEKKMFGGIAFLLNGKMLCGVIDSDLMVRVGPARHDEALARPHAREMDFTGRPLTGYVYVAPRGTATAASLRNWVLDGFSFVSTLPARAPNKKRAPAPRRRPRR
jgi:TfoX/Sxy family transcriptional regulator of competence genes